MNKGKPIRILIVDDHPVVRAGLTSMLSSRPQLQVIGAAASGDEALRIINSSLTDVVFLDLRMPKVDGIEVLKQIVGLKNAPKVVILTSFERDEDIYRAMQAGAHGYLTKEATEGEMLEALTTACEGRRYLPPHLAMRLAERSLR